jgi:hypothetical protein
MNQSQVVYAEGPRELQSHGIEGESFAHLAKMMLADLRKQGPSIIVCGPISTGGTGH